MKKMVFIVFYALVYNLSMAQNLPDVTTEFEQIISDTKIRCEGLRDKWPVDNQTILAEFAWVVSKKFLDKKFRDYLSSIKSWSNMEARLNYMMGAYKENGPGDIKNGKLKKYNVNGGRVMYKGKQYTVEQLGNINFGIAAKAIGINYLTSACAAGCYQVIADNCLSPGSEDAKKYLKAIKDAIKNREVPGVCMDYRGDSKMIKMGYNWF